MAEKQVTATKRYTLKRETLRLHRSNLKTRESNRLKYRSGSGSASRNFIFNGSVPVQVQDFSKIWVQVQFGFSCTKI